MAPAEATAPAGRTAFRLDGRVALVTGAGRGIGAATAEFLAGQGAFVVVNDIDGEAATATAASLGRDRAAAAPGDVANGPALRGIVQRIESEHGHIDILVNNAAAPSPVADFLQLPEETWAESLSSFEGTLGCTRAVLAGMVARGGGRVVNVTSIGGVHGVAGMSVYSAAKGAIHAFTAALAKEVAHAGVTVNCVAPGTVDTPRQRARNPELQARRREAIPLGRFAAASEVAAAVAFFASDEAAYITGEVLLVDGGRP
jgi:NAD(P)-dependent dehydrogenase (short-subunit alcohol dehydrogenase family)